MQVAVNFEECLKDSPCFRCGGEGLLWEGLSGDLGWVGGQAGFLPPLPSLALFIARLARGREKGIRPPLTLLSAT